MQNISNKYLRPTCEQTKQKIKIIRYVGYLLNYLDCYCYFVTFTSGPDAKYAQSRRIKVLREAHNLDQLKSPVSDQNLLSKCEPCEVRFDS